MNTLHVWAQFSTNTIRSSLYPVEESTYPESIAGFFRDRPYWFTSQIRDGYQVITIPDGFDWTVNQDPGSKFEYFDSPDHYHERNPKVIIVNRRVRAMERVYIKLRQGQTDGDAINIANCETHQQIIKKDPLVHVQLEDSQYWTLEPVTDAEEFLQEAS